MSDAAEKQLRDWVSQLAPEYRLILVGILREDGQLQQSARLNFAELQLRKLCSSHGRQWDSLSEKDQEVFLGNLIRETEVYATQSGTNALKIMEPCPCCGREMSPNDLYKTYFGERLPKVENAAALLVVMDIEGDLQFRIAADRETIIGRLDPYRGIRPEVDLTKFDPATRVSRRHARIISQTEQFFVEDMGSANGTLINGIKKLNSLEPYPLVNGDIIKIGDTNIKFMTL